MGLGIGPLEEVGGYFITLRILLGGGLGDWRRGRIFLLLFIGQTLKGWVVAEEGLTS